MTDIANALGEISYKSFDYLGSLDIQYEAGLITEGEFRMALQTMWACMGGVVDNELFNLVISEGNKTAADMPPTTYTGVRHAGKRMFIVSRDQEKVCVEEVEVIRRTEANYSSVDKAAAAAKRVLNR